MNQCTTSLDNNSCVLGTTTIHGSINVKLLVEFHMQSAPELPLSKSRASIRDENSLQTRQLAYDRVQQLCPVNSNLNLSMSITW